MMSFRTLLLAFVLLPLAAFSQNHGDCATALKICNKDSIHFDQTGGTGTAQEAGLTCLMDEFSSTWISWIISNPGTLTFTLTPFAGDDLDFAVYKFGVLNDCDAKSLVRCMAAGENVGEPFPNWEICTGATGLNLTETDVEEQAGCSSGNNNFLAALQCEPGDQFVMLVNNFSNSGAGFSLEFGGTAHIFCPNANAAGEVEGLASSLAIRPNPVREQLSVELPSLSSGASVRIFNQLGRLVHAEKLSAGKLELDVSAWQPGVYYFLAEQAGKMSSQRFVKI